MKKILFGILTFLGIGLSFCSAQIDINSNLKQYLIDNSISSGTFVSNCNSSSCSSFYFTILYDRGFESNNSSYYNYCVLFDTDVPNFSINSNGIVLRIASNTNPSSNVPGPFLYSSSLTTTGNIFAHILCNLGRRRYLTIGSRSNSDSFKYYVFDISTLSNFKSCPDSLIDVQYNNGNTTTINCDGINYITIDGLSSLESSNVNYEYSPYFNISYKDQDNQSLIESYDKSILYLENGQFKKTYTGNNDRILTVQGGNNSNFSGYLPTFDVVFTGDSLDTGNIFNNFAENSLKFTLSNIPSYIQYVIIIMLLFLILGFIRKFKRK